MIFYKPVEVLISQVINYVFFVRPGSLRSLRLRCLWATRQTDTAEQELSGAKQSFWQVRLQAVTWCRCLYMYDMLTLPNSFHNCTHPELISTETQIKLEEGLKKSTRSSWGKISNGRGWSKEITRLFGYYIIEIRCIFCHLFTLLRRLLPFSQHSHFVVHRSHCKWKKN